MTEPPVAPADGRLIARGLPPWIWRLMAVVIISILATLAGLYVAYRVKEVLFWIVAALFASLVLEPGVDWLDKHGWRRGAATGFVIFLAILGLIGFVVLMTPLVIREVTQLVKALPGWLDSLSRWTEQFGIDLTPSGLMKQLQSAGASLQNTAAEVAGNVLGVLGKTLGTLLSLASVGLFTFYFVAEGPKMRRAICSTLPQDKQEEVIRVWDVAIEKTGAYIYSRLLLGFINGGLFFVLLQILGVPFSLALAVWIGFMSQFIPVIGSYIGAALPALVAWAEVGFGSAVVVVVYSIVYQNIENLLIAPKISARTLKLHPAVAFGAAVAGVLIAGILGAFMALPLAAVIQAASSTYIHRHDVIEAELLRDEDAERAAERAAARKRDEKRRFFPRRRPSD